MHDVSDSTRTSQAVTSRDPPRIYSRTRIIFIDVVHASVLLKRACDQIQSSILRNALPSLCNSSPCMESDVIIVHRKPIIHRVLTPFPKKVQPMVRWVLNLPFAGTAFRWHTVYTARIHRISDALRHAFHQRLSQSDATLLYIVASPEPPDNVMHHLFFVFCFDFVDHFSRSRFQQSSRSSRMPWLLWPSDSSCGVSTS